LRVYVQPAENPSVEPAEGTPAEPAEGTPAEPAEPAEMCAEVAELEWAAVRV